MLAQDARFVENAGPCPRCDSTVWPIRIDVAQDGSHVIVKCRGTKYCDQTWRVSG